MCTAITYQTKDFYVGRTLDNGCSYGEQVTVTPRRYPFQFRHLPTLAEHYAMIGMACVLEGYPLYYDGANEKGLGMVGLNFTGTAVYCDCCAPGEDNVAQYELIPWILGQCATVQEARERLSRVRLLNTPFRPGLPAARLHWLIADEREAVTVEFVEEGLKLYENPVGVLTNEPAFDRQLFRLNDFLALSPKAPENRFSDRLNLHPYSYGMGALGLPGDLSSQSRFVRGAFVRMNAVSGGSELESVSQFFHILGAVEQQRGCCVREEGEYEVTLYTSCCNTRTGVYYYTTYDNHQITGVDLRRCPLEGGSLSCYPLVQGERIAMQN